MTPPREFPPLRLDELRERAMRVLRRGGRDLPLRELLKIALDEFEKSDRRAEELRLYTLTLERRLSGLDPDWKMKEQN